MIVVIAGPTATGKSELAVELALRINGEIVSADSMQIYRDMDIGTAKPSVSERRGVPHYMVDVVDPAERYSVSRYVDEATVCVDSIISRGKVPILVGGTGLYIDSLLRGREFAPPCDMSLRQELELEYDELGGVEMLEWLRGFDPCRASRLHPGDRKRIVRAVEVYMLTGQTITEHDRQSAQQPSRYRAEQIVLGYKSREDMYRRIDARVDKMMELGLEQEVRGLLARGLTREHTAMQAIGYKELAGTIYGEISQFDAVEQIKRETRRYSKRQLTWFRDRGSQILWGEVPEIEYGVEKATENLRGMRL